MTFWILVMIFLAGCSAYGETPSRLQSKIDDDAWFSDQYPDWDGNPKP